MPHIEVDYKSTPEPSYYSGKKYGYSARKVVEDFQPDSYNLGTAISYLLRAGKKEGNPAELITFGLGKLGGREPNYHSDLDAIFLYSSNGETKRRMGGHRATLTNQQFFNQLTQRVITRINQPGPDGRLYELDSRLRDTGEEGVWAMTLEDFEVRFQENTAPLWQRLALCKARSISGSRELRIQADEAIAAIIRNTEWKPEMAIEIREMRERMEQTATPAQSAQPFDPAQP